MNDQDPSFSPYPGLRAFESDEAHLFFGREQQSDELLRRLATHRFLAIVGTSGCGKSSLVKAGLLPGLHGGFMVSAGSAWRIASMRPGETPISTLAAALNAPGVLGDVAPSREGPVAPTDFTEVSLRRGPLGLVDAARALWPSSGGNLLVLVDQFEETIRATLQGSLLQAEEATAFVKLLLEAVRQTDLPIHVVLTMRSDYLGLCSRFRGLPEAINEGQYLVPRLTRDQLRSAIVGPAAVAGATVTTPLVQTLLEEVGDDQDRLPVLQHALMRTWTLRSQPDTMDLPDYAKTGGLANALSNHANEIFRGLDARGREIARLMFQRLTEGGEPGQETRRWARMSEICEVAQASHEQVADVVEAFRAPGRSFLMPPPGVPLTPETTLDISHESLIRQWDELKRWTEAERKSAEQYQRLSAAADLHAQRKVSLWRSPELDIALGWSRQQPPTSAWARRYAGDFTRAMTFLRKSQGAQLRRRVLLGLSVLVAAAVVFAFIRLQANEVARRRLDARFVAAGQAVDPLTRALALAELGSNSRSFERAEMHLRLYLNVASSPVPRAVLGRRSTGNAVIAVDFASGDRIITVDSRRVLRLWRADGRGEPKTWNVSSVSGSEGHDRRPLAVATFSGDSAWFAGADADGMYWGQTDGSRLSQVALPPDFAGVEPSAIALSHTGARLALGFPDYRVGIWRRGNDGEIDFERSLTRQTSPISGLDFDRSDTRLATASWDGALRAWNPETGERLVEIPPVEATGLPPTANSVKFSPDGRWLVGGYSDHAARVWPSAGGDRPAVILQAHVDGVTAAAFTPSTGEPRAESDTQVVVVTTSKDRTARIWTLRRDPTGLQLTGTPSVLRGHARAVSGAAFSPDGLRVVTASIDGTARVWSTDTQEPRLLGRHGAEVESVAFNASGTGVVTASRDGTARVWDVAGSAPPLKLDHGALVRSASFNPVDEYEVATGSRDQRVRLWDLRTNRARVLDVKGSDQSSQNMSVMAVAWGRDGKWLGAAAADGAARIWPLAPNPGDVVLLEHQRHVHMDHGTIWVLDIDFSPAAMQVVTVSEDGMARFWDYRGGLVRAIEVEPHTHPPTVGDDPRVVKVHFNPSGDRIATASGDVVRVWPVEGDRQTWEIRHAAAVNDVAFQPVDGRSLIAALEDGMVIVSDTRSGREIVRLGNGTPVAAAAFSPSGQQVVTGDRDGAVRLWRLHIADLVAYLRQATTACLTPTDRVRLLEEDEDDAGRAYESCERQYGRVPAR